MGDQGKVKPAVQNIMDQLGSKSTMQLDIGVEGTGAGEPQGERPSAVDPVYCERPMFKFASTFFDSETKVWSISADMLIFGDKPAL